MFVELSTLRVSPNPVPPPSPARELRVQFLSTVDAVDAVVTLADVAPEPAAMRPENASSQQSQSQVLHIRVE